ncbi:MAG: hypothetical protein ACI91T_002335, partial [Natronomonas sp.]
PFADDPPVGSREQLAANVRVEPTGEFAKPVAVTRIAGLVEQVGVNQLVTNRGRRGRPATLGELRPGEDDRLWISGAMFHGAGVSFGVLAHRPFQIAHRHGEVVPVDYFAGIHFRHGNKLLAGTIRVDSKPAGRGGDVGSRRSLGTPVERIGRGRPFTLP